ncbi:MAG: hypothetical protein E7411_01345 [Ruminococcaceae bacterium]|nr:hypothetical protein [Oscillospiraceae bacterium]
MDDQITPEKLRETGKILYFHSENDADKKRIGLNMLVDASNLRDPEAQCIVGDFILKGILPMSDDIYEKKGLSLLRTSALKGFSPARVLLDKYCTDKYDKIFKGKNPYKNGPLTDFKGKRIKIKRKGFFTPVDALLEYKDGKNILTLSCNLSFFDDCTLDNFEDFKKAVIDGVMMWEGEYEVFGGQRITVKMNVTDESRVFDSVYIFPFTETFQETVEKNTSIINIKSVKERSEKILSERRSMATLGFRWKATSTKLIYIFSSDSTFTDYDEITHVAKHEFGHVLGLGDLYSSPSDGLFGVHNGTYRELDSYSLDDKLYNLVMCDHHGPVSNNDIEMILLAFQKNKIQLFQPWGKLKKISEALGKGN